MTNCASKKQSYNLFYDIVVVTILSVTVLSQNEKSERMRYKYLNVVLKFYCVINRKINESVRCKSKSDNGKFSKNEVVKYSQI